MEVHIDPLSSSQHVRGERKIISINSTLNAATLFFISDLNCGKIVDLYCGASQSKELLSVQINCHLHFDPAREDVSFGFGTICSKFYDSEVEKDKEQSQI